ncbi:MAG: RecQ family zinc-binding domain-containing protein, partial [Brachybacterium sp.]|nr:RecQ family zinc-binding domain-containing protein [Brachybacterium sp.]
TGRPWTYDGPRYENVARARRQEQQAMLEYERLQPGDPQQCRMMFLAQQLDDDTATPCGRCDVCAGPWYPAPGAQQGSGEPDAASQQVSAVLDRVGVPVAPRAQWPQGLDRLGVLGEDGKVPRGNIPAALRAEEGRALARTSDLGWAAVLRQVLRTDDEGRPIDSEVPDVLGRRIIEVLAAWDWQRRPEAVVAIPSLTRPQLVGSLAAGIASVGRLTDLGRLGLAPQAAPLRAGGNSAFRLADLWDRFVVTEELQQSLAQLDGAPLLLVDDTISSRWTMTVAARALRRAGAGPVLPLALALEA